MPALAVARAWQPPTPQSRRNLDRTMPEACLRGVVLYVIRPCVHGLGTTALMIIRLRNRARVTSGFATQQTAHGSRYIQGRHGNKRPRAPVLLVHTQGTLVRPSASWLTPFAQAAVARHGFARARGWDSITAPPPSPPLPRVGGTGRPDRLRCHDMPRHWLAQGGR